MEMGFKRQPIRSKSINLHSNLVLRLLEPHPVFCMPRLGLLITTLISSPRVALGVNLCLIRLVLVIDMIDCICLYAVKQFNFLSPARFAFDNGVLMTHSHLHNSSL